MDPRCYRATLARFRPANSAPFGHIRGLWSHFRQLCSSTRDATCERCRRFYKFFAAFSLPLVKVQRCILCIGIVPIPCFSMEMWLMSSARVTVITNRLTLFALITTQSEFWAYFDAFLNDSGSNVQKGLKKGPDTVQRGSRKGPERVQKGSKKGSKGSKKRPKGS